MATYIPILSESIKTARTPSMASQRQSDEACSKQYRRKLRMYNKFPIVNLMKIGSNKNWPHRMNLFKEDGHVPITFTKNFLCGMALHEGVTMATVMYSELLASLHIPEKKIVVHGDDGNDDGNGSWWEKKKKHLPISEDWEVDGLRALRKHHYFYFNQFLERDESKH